MRLAICTPLPILAFAAAAQAALLEDLSLELRSDSNITRAQLERDIKSDTSLTLSGATATARAIGDHGRLKLSLTLAATAHQRYRGLNHLEAELGLRQRWKLGLGPLAPTLEAAASVARLEYDDRARDGWEFVLALGLEKRLGERLGMRLDYSVERRRADHVAKRLLPTIAADVFDLNLHSLRLGGDYALTPELYATAAFTIIDGDIVSTTLRNLPIFLASDAIAADEVFGPQRFAYTMDARTRSLQLGVSRVVGPETSLSLGFEHRSSHATGGIDYRSNLWRATYLRGF